MYSQNQIFPGNVISRSHNVELITFKKFKKIWTTGCRNINKNVKKAPKFFSTFLLKHKAVFYPYGALTSCKISGKTNEQSLAIFKDRQTNRQRVKGNELHQVNQGSKISLAVYSYYVQYISACLWKKQ